MEGYAAFNKLYGALFSVDPPSRFAVQVHAEPCRMQRGLTWLPSPQVPGPPRVRFRAAPAGRRPLHVQSFSRWAPANIGPYSQATTIEVGCTDALMGVGGCGMGMA